MKNKVWIVFLALSIAFACSAGYLLISYQNEGTQTERAMEDLRVIKQSAQTQEGQDPQVMPTAAILGDPEDNGEPEALATEIPVDFEGFDDVEAVVSVEPTAVMELELGVGTVTDNETTEVATAETAEIEATVAPADTMIAEPAVARESTPRPIATEVPLDELNLPTATATAKVEYSLNTVVPLTPEEAMPTNWVPKEKYILKKEDILPEYRELYEINNELIGWITIEGTKIDYPVVQTENPNFYLNHDFYKRNNINGMLVVTPEYDVLTPSQLILIHGHNMRNGKMFNNLQYYASRSFYEKHPFIKFDTLTEHREYQVVSAFYTRIYGPKEPGFRYNVILNGDVEVTKYFVTGVRNSAAYETGVYFDRFDEYLALSTCAYQAKNGRFVVVAKRVQP